MRPEEIARVLRRAIRERVLGPGEVLNQDHLARRFGVSRVPLREALRTLAGEGLVVMKPGLGALVTELEPDEVNELYELRLHLEPPLAPAVVEHARRVDVDMLASIVDSMQQLAEGESEEWSTLNYSFHRRLYELSERKHFLRLVVQVLNLVEPYARVHAHVLGSRQRMQDQRMQMVAALRAGDPATLRSLLVESITTARAELIASMRNGTPNADPFQQVFG